MPTLISGTTGVTFPDNSSQNTAATGFGFKNRIINGAMVIDQRNAGASVTPTSGGYLLDRWTFQPTQASKMSVQQSTTVPAGFKNSVLFTTVSAYSVAAGDFFLWSQAIEGFNVADFNWGTANAQSITISFQVRSSLTGTFGGSVHNSAANRSYPFTFTINSANTFETKTITIAGDTSGTWLTDNGAGLWLRFGLGVGSTYSGTAGAWAAATYYSATGATSVVGTNGATFYITGVQLEKGSTATSFDYRPYGTELALCQRYYFYYNIYSTFIGQRWTTSLVWASVPTPVVMRTTPTVANTGSGALITRADGGQVSSNSSINTVSTQSAGMPMAIVIFNTSFDPSSNCTFAVYSSGLTLSAEL